MSVPHTIAVPSATTIPAGNPESHVDPVILATAEERGWPPGFFERFYGCIDDETFVAPARRAPNTEANLE